MKECVFYLPFSCPYTGGDIEIRFVVIFKLSPSKWKEGLNLIVCYELAVWISSE